jgi:hypothetical protein
MIDGNMQRELANEKPEYGARPERIGRIEVDKSVPPIVLLKVASV